MEKEVAFNITGGKFHFVSSSDVIWSDSTFKMWLRGDAYWESGQANFHTSVSQPYFYLSDYTVQQSARFLASTVNILQSKIYNLEKCSFSKKKKLRDKTEIQGNKLNSLGLSSRYKTVNRAFTHWPKCWTFSHAFCSKLLITRSIPRSTMPVTRARVSGEIIAGNLAAVRGSSDPSKSTRQFATFRPFSPDNLPPVGIFISARHPEGHF